MTTIEKQAPLPQSQVNQMSADDSDLIPSGSWTIWYHSPKETKWMPSTYQQVGTVRTWTEYWTLMDAIGDNTLLNAFFFVMRDPATPLWENKLNIRGGGYSLRIGRKDAADIFHKYIIGAMTGCVAMDPANKLMGVTISPKRGFNVINVWNEDFAKYNANDGLKLITKLVGPEEIRYTRHLDKKIN
jgi:hypothetical protein